jgi:beta-lactam-binding protein with PASTA domain
LPVLDRALFRTTLANPAQHQIELILRADETTTPGRWRIRLRANPPNPNSFTFFNGFLPPDDRAPTYTITINGTNYSGHWVYDWRAAANNAQGGTTTTIYDIFDREINFTASTINVSNAYAEGGLTNAGVWVTGLGQATVSGSIANNLVTEALPNTFTNIPYVNGTVNRSYNDVVFSTGTTTNISRSGALPPGLTGAYESSTQGYRVQGIPTTAGTYSFTLTASNSSGGTTTYAASIAISNPVTFSTPNVIGSTQSSATSTLRAAGFGSVSSALSQSGSTVLNNLIVFNQLPSAGATATEGDSASISVYDYRLPVPNIVGQTRDIAISTITGAGFSLYSSTLSTTNATLANNLTVRTQTPTAGTSLNIASSISFVLHDYRVKVPNVVGQTQDNAIALLAVEGFTNVSIALTLTGATAENVGTVRTQSPTNAATATNPATTSVSLTVYSLGVTGRRYSANGFIGLTTVRRYTGQDWTPLTIQRRYDGNVWRDITN